MDKHHNNSWWSSKGHSPRVLAQVSGAMGDVKVQHLYKLLNIFLFHSGKWGVRLLSFIRGQLTHKWVKLWLWASHFLVPFKILGRGLHNISRWIHIFTKFAKLRGVNGNSATMVTLHPLVCSLSLVALEWLRAFLCLLQQFELDGLSLGLVGCISVVCITVNDKSLLAMLV